MAGSFQQSELNRIIHHPSRLNLRPFITMLVPSMMVQPKLSLVTVQPTRFASRTWSLTNWLVQKRLNILGVAVRLFVSFIVDTVQGRKGLGSTAFFTFFQVPQTESPVDPSGDPTGQSNTPINGFRAFWHRLDLPFSVTFRKK